MNIDFNKYPLPDRLRHHTSPNLYHKKDELRLVPESYPPIYENIDWSQYFTDARPAVALDIGCGKGAFLLDYAELHPGANILGIELRRPLAEWLGRVIKSERIGNCAAIWYSVVNGLNFMAPGSVASVFYFFPDPWPKTKHAKRRVLSLEFLDEIDRILSPDGKLYIATDVMEIHDYHRKILKKSGKFAFGSCPDDESWGLPLTNKERFCRTNRVHYERLVCARNEGGESIGSLTGGESK